MHRQRELVGRHDRHRREILDRVVAYLLQVRHDGHLRRRRHEQGVAVRLGPRHVVGGDRAIGAGPVVDHHRLLEPGGQPFGGDPRDAVGIATGGERHDQRDRALGPCRMRGARRGQ